MSPETGLPVAVVSNSSNSPISNSGVDRSAILTSIAPILTVAANASRHALNIQNVSSVSIYISWITATPAGTNGYVTSTSTYTIAPGVLWNCTFCGVGAVYIAGDTAQLAIGNQLVAITEI
jgi:hypothetical protein